MKSHEMSISLHKQVVTLLLFLLMLGCTGKQDNPASEKRIWLATTGMIGDALRQLADSSIQVEVLMGPGVDPHLYKATQGDLLKLRQAELIVYNGHHLEGKLAEVLGQLGSSKPSIALAELLPIGELIRADGNAVDPHIWFDVALWNKSIQLLTDSLIQLYPTLEEGLSLRQRVLSSSLDSLDSICRQTLMALPAEKRILVTAHDAFGYWGRAYGMEVMGLQGISTLSDFGLKDLNELVDLLVTRKIPAVFVESSVPRRSIEAVIQGCRGNGHELRLGGELYSDAMGETSSPEGTYIGMVHHNLNTMIHALSTPQP